MKKISLVFPCFNEELNVDEIYLRTRNVINNLTDYDFDFIFIDNASTDATLEKLKALATSDLHVKIISNTRNFGHIRSPYWGLLQSQGDAAILIASDLQDPPELIPQFLVAWEEGYKIALAVKPESRTNPVVHSLRKLYYRILDAISEIPIVRDATGFGLYDRCVLEKIREINDPYPFFRGLVCELGYPIKKIQFTQARRVRGISKNNFYTLYDIAMLGIVSHSLIPIRMAAFFGVATGLLSILVAFVFLGLKLLFWDRIPVGVAPLMIGMFFMFGVVLVFIGILGEYIASIHGYVRNRPIVVEQERINF